MTNVVDLPVGHTVIEGFNGTLTMATQSGTRHLGNISLNTVVVPGAETLFALPDVARNNGSFYGDENRLHTFDTKQKFSYSG